MSKQMKTNRKAFYQQRGWNYVPTDWKRNCCPMVVAPSELLEVKFSTGETVRYGSWFAQSRSWNKSTGGKVERFRIRTAVKSLVK